MLRGDSVLLRAKRPVIKVFVITLIISLLLILFLDMLLYPMIKSMSLQRSKTQATYIINKSVTQILDDGDYDNLIFFDKDSKGRIAAMKTDSVRMNKLKSLIAIQIHNNLSAYSHDDIYIPIGSLFRNSFVTGKGPKIKVCIKPAGAVVCDYRNVFESAGINQTNHRVMVDITASIYVVMPFHCEKTAVTTSVCVSDTIIVGEIPEAFTNVQNYNSDSDGGISDDVMDFGAHNYFD